MDGFPTLFASAFEPSWDALTYSDDLTRVAVSAAGSPLAGQFSGDAP